MRKSKIRKPLTREDKSFILLSMSFLHSKQKQSYFFSIIFLSLALSLSIMSCNRQHHSSLKHEELFRLSYGSFEDELDLFSLGRMGTIQTYLQMKDGFFYIANGEAKKILQLTSYGDLLSIIYNAETNPKPSFIHQFDQNQGDDFIATQHAVSYPFNEIGHISVDFNKTVYVSEVLPLARQEIDEEQNLLLSQIILIFSKDGSFIDYLGQEGPGGRPFPYISNIFTNKQNELIVTCLNTNGQIVYWFSAEGFLKYTIPISNNALPELESDMQLEASLDSIVPDYSAEKLYVKIDYYKNYLDPDTNAIAGIDFYNSAVSILDLESQRYEEPIIIPAYTEVVSQGYTKLNYSIPYDFLGVSESGWLFFTIPDQTGFMVQMLQPNGQKILKNHFALDLSKVLYHKFSLSQSGIISALLAEEDAASIVWWRTDSIIDSLLK